jgi:hypothetical protein
MKLRFAAIIFLVATLSGCATKHCGRQGTLTPNESTSTSCKDIDLELAKIDEFKDHVKKESRFVGRSVLSAFSGALGWMTSWKRVPR